MTGREPDGPWEVLKVEIDQIRRTVDSVIQELKELIDQIHEVAAGDRERAVKLEVRLERFGERLAYMEERLHILSDHLERHIQNVASWIKPVLLTLLSAVVLALVGLAFKYVIAPPPIPPGGLP